MLAERQQGQAWPWPRRLLQLQPVWHLHTIAAGQREPALLELVLASEPACHLHSGWEVVRPHDCSVLSSEPAVAAESEQKVQSRRPAKAWCQRAVVDQSKQELRQMEELECQTSRLACHWPEWLAVAALAVG